ncbi:MAG: CpaF family protein [Caldilineae bacterium]|nr:MAG: CpaF family protein [Caldilineae bacterium]
MTPQNQSNPLAPLESLLNDPHILEIMAAGYDNVQVERDGKLEDIPSPFKSEAHLLDVIEALLAPLGIKADESNPLVDARLFDGSRVNVVMPPICLNGPVLTIRKFLYRKLTLQDLLRFHSLNEAMVDFLRACVRGRLNMVIAGGTNSGKTTVLNLVGGMIPDDERILVVQNATEFRLPQKWVITLESRPPNLEGKGEVTVQDLVINALRMRPDRLIVGEVRGAEALEVIQAINNGHEGTMMNIHASSPRDVLSRLETMVTYANLSIPLLSIRKMIASAIDVITYQERLPDGSRKVTKISEVLGMQGDVIELKDIFEFRQTGVKDGKISGHFTATGHIPQFLSRLQSASGAEVPLSLFTPR